MTGISFRIPSRRLALVLVLAAGTLVSSMAVTAAPPVNTLKSGLFSSHGNTAIGGYDTVAYFTDGKAVAGDDAFTYEWRGAKWKFASRAHLELFRGAPEKYAPQYGGYCAYGISQGDLVGIEPDKFKVLSGKLYLNFNAEVQEKWLKNPTAYIRQADAKFQSLLGK